MRLAASLISRVLVCSSQVWRSYRLGAYLNNGRAPVLRGLMMNLADTQPPVALFRIGPMMTSPRRGLNTVLVYMHSVSEGCMSSNMASVRIAEAVVMADPPRMKTKGGNSLLKQRRNLPERQSRTGAWVEPRVRASFDGGRIRRRRRQWFNRRCLVMVIETSTYHHRRNEHGCGQSETHDQFSLVPHFSAPMPKVGLTDYRTR
jgi:hypothetical protein